MRLWPMLFALCLALTGPVFAACSSPTGGTGQIVYDNTNKVLTFCNGTNWQNLGTPNPGGGSSCSSPTGAAGQVVYSSATNVMAYCNGTNWVNMGTANSGVTSACTSPAGPRGQLIYNTTANNLQYCNGTAWVNAGNWQSSVASSCTTSSESFETASPFGWTQVATTIAADTTTFTAGAASYKSTFHVATSSFGTIKKNFNISGCSTLKIDTKYTGAAGGSNGCKVTVSTTSVIYPATSWTTQTFSLSGLTGTNTIQLGATAAVAAGTCNFDNMQIQ